MNRPLCDVDMSSPQGSIAFLWARNIHFTLVKGSYLINMCLVQEVLNANIGFKPKNVLALYHDIRSPKQCLVSGQDFLSGTWREGYFNFNFLNLFDFVYYENMCIVRGKCTSMPWDGHSMSARRKCHAGSRVPVHFANRSFSRPERPLRYVAKSKKFAHAHWVGPLGGW
jgi:hypothetical protein